MNKGSKQVKKDTFVNHFSEYEVIICQQCPALTLELRFLVENKFTQHSEKEHLDTFRHTLKEHCTDLALDFHNTVSLMIQS